MRPLGWLVVAGLAGSVACMGSVEPVQGSQPDAGVGSGDAGNTQNDAGTVGNGGGGGTDAGSGTGADGGSGSGGGSGDGSGGGDAGPADGGRPDGGGATADVCPGAPRDPDPPEGIACNEIVPKNLATFYSFTADDRNTVAACTAEVIDESGNIAVAFGDAVGGARFWDLYRAGGAHTAQITAYDLWPQGCGFEGTSDVGDYSTDVVGSWSPDGSRVGSAVVGGDIVARSFHASPNGILTLLSSCVFPPSAPNGRSAIGHFDPAGGALGGISLALPCDGIVRTLASDVRGRIFLLAHDANGIAGMWLDSAGTAITSWFHVGSGGTKQDVLAPLVGGGVGVRVDGVWRYVVASGEAQSQPAPDFLASNPGADLALIRGAHAYALLPRTDSDESELRLYSGSGEFCGSLAFPGRRINTGADGSVIASSGSHFCHKTIWSRLLR